MATVGQILRTEREKKRLTLKQVEKEMRVREKFLQAIENNDWSPFSSKIYITGIINNYSRFLGLDITKMAAFFRRDYSRKEEMQFQKKISAQYLTSHTKKVVVAGLVGIFFVFSLYFTYQLIQFFTPPRVTILSPQLQRFHTEERITIRGKTEKEASITIFGERVYPNKEGIFEYTYPLHPGSNKITIEVVGANAKKTILTKEYFKD